MGVALAKETAGGKKSKKGEAKKPEPKQDFALSMVPPDSPSLMEGKLKEIPAQWSTKYKPIKRELFVNDACYYRALSRQHAKKAETLNKRADELEKLGNVKDRDAAKRFLTMKNRILELAQKMSAEGNQDFVQEALKQLQAPPTA